MADAGATQPHRVEVAGKRLRGWVARFAERHGGVTSVTADETGAVLHLATTDGSWADVDVPWPPLPARDGADALVTLADHVVAPRRLGLLLVRKGGYAVGVVDGGRLVQSKVGSRHVQGRTKAGGWSQQRYARRRTQQARAAYGAASEVAARLLVPVVETLDGLVPGGDRKAVEAVLDERALRPLAELPRGRFLAVPDPRLRVLEQAASDCLAVVVHVADVTR